MAKKAGPSKVRKLSRLVDTVEKFEEKLRQDVKEALYEAFEEFFSKHPEVGSIIWTQFVKSGRFTRSEFDVMKFELKLKGSEEYYDNGEDCDVTHLRDCEDNDRNRRYQAVKEALGAGALRQLTQAELALCENYEEIERACVKAKKFMEKIFGDDVKVIARPEGFDVTRSDERI